MYHLSEDNQVLRMDGEAGVAEVGVLVFGVFFFKIFLMWTIFKVFIEFVDSIASVLCFGFLAPRHVGS